MRIGDELDDGRAEANPRARRGRPHVHGRGGRAALRASCRARRTRPAALARPARRSDDRRAPRAEPLRPVAAPLRGAAGSRARRDARARGRNDGERGRQGREERRGLRPRTPRLRLARAARADRASELPAAPATEGDRDARRRDRRRGRCRRSPSQLTTEPSALDVLHPGRVAVLFEGSERAVAAQLVSGASAGRRRGERRCGLAGVADRQACGRRPRPLRPGRSRRRPRDLDEAVVRVNAGVAYTAAENPSTSLSQGARSSSSSDYAGSTRASPGVSVSLP